MNRVSKKRGRTLLVAIKQKDGPVLLLFMLCHVADGRSAQGGTSAGAGVIISKDVEKRREGLKGIK